MQNGMSKTMDNISKSTTLIVSDLHLGAHKDNRDAEQRFIKCLDHYQQKGMKDLVLLGDIFDCWFEYKRVIPKGFVRTLGFLGTLADKGVKIYFFAGNHDMWLRDYFEKELDATICFHTQKVPYNEGYMLLGHGDGFAPQEKTYRMLKKWIYKNKICLWIYRWLHPDIGMILAQELSYAGKRKKHTGVFIDFIAQKLLTMKNEKIKLGIFGHLHKGYDKQLSPTLRYINLGDWFNKNKSPHIWIENNKIEYKETY